MALAASPSPEPDSGAPTPAAIGCGTRPKVTLELMRVPELAPGEEAALRRVLSDDERERADRFRFAADRRTYTAARAALRRLLAAATGAEPQALVFDYNPFGKPTLRDVPELRFNLSHTRDAIAIAWSREVELGVDLERLEPDRAPLEAARFCFAPSECAALARCVPARCDELFVAFWTLKEAYVKARGEGLSLPLDDFAFALDPAGATVEYADAHGEPGPDWRFRRGRALGDHAWALALRSARDVALEVREDADAVGFGLARRRPEAGRAATG